MITYHAVEFEGGEPRAHPWKGTTKSDSVNCIDFKVYPEKIRTDLEDWVPYQSAEFTEEFYQLLEWVNGPDSVFESNDCAFVGREKNTDKQFKFKKRSRGRLMILLRDEHLNCQHENIDWIFNNGMRELSEIDKDFKAGAFGLSFLVTIYSALSPEPMTGAQGWQVQFSFWAYGSSDELVDKSLLRVLVNFRAVLESLNKRAIDGEMLGEKS